MGENGSYHKHEEKLDKIGDDVHFVRESVIPISTAIKDLSHVINNLNGALDNLSEKIQDSIDTQRHSVPIKVVAYIFAIVFGLVFGVEFLRHNLGFFGGA